VYIKKTKRRPTMANWKKIQNNPVREEADESLINDFVGFGGLVVAGYALYWMLAGVVG